MYTYHSWFFDKGGSLFYHYAFQAASIPDAHLKYAELIISDKRLLDQMYNADAEYGSIIPTSSMAIAPHSGPSNHRFCLACTMLGLTDTETNVLLIMRNTKSRDKVAKQAGNSPNTIKTHCQNIYDKLDVNSRTEALQKVYEYERSIKTIHPEVLAKNTPLE